MSLFRNATLALVVVAIAGPAVADCDVETGEEVYRKCKTCHQIGDDAKNKVGPVLNGIVGAAFGAVDGFAYSEAVAARKAQGAVWTEEELDAFLASPKKYLKGTKMSFPGLRKEAERIDVICYLKTFG